MDLFSIYFPQFYPIKINDRTWGKGFTDWDLVSIANMRKGWERRAPKKGFYNGNSEETFKVQIKEMLEYGLGGIALYHYHFDNSYELNKMEQYLHNQSEIDWFLIWANENWSKRWIGDPKIILSLSTKPSKKFIDEHVDYLIKLMNSKNYRKIDGKPIFGFYKLDHFDNPERVIINYRKSFMRYNTEIYMIIIISNIGELELTKIVDGAYIFEPRFFYNNQRSLRASKSRNYYLTLKKLFGDNIVNRILTFMDRFQQNGNSYKFKGYINHLKEFKLLLRKTISEKKLNWILSSGWNNYPRYNENFTKLDAPTPMEFVETLNIINEIESELPPIINAWNEWSEGAAIEPCYYYNDRYLKCIKTFKKS